jgi:hypothetical protein
MVKGTKEEVYNGTADKTAGGLTKADLMISKSGKVVSKKQSEAAQKRLPLMYQAAAKANPERFKKACEEVGHSKENTDNIDMKKYIEVSRLPSGTMETIEREEWHRKNNELLRKRQKEYDEMMAKAASDALLKPKPAMIVRNPQPVIELEKRTPISIPIPPKPKPKRKKAEKYHMASPESNARAERRGEELRAEWAEIFKREKEQGIFERIRYV